MPIFKKKPVHVEAKRFEGIDDWYAQEALADWCNGKLRGQMLPPSERVIQIQTLEGEMEAKVGDWIIRGIKGEFYPCKPDIFAATYDPVS